MSRLHATLMKSKQSKRTRPEVNSQMRRRTLELLALEDRVTPANFVVTNLNDSGPGSLRDAVVSANALFGPDTITFSVSGTITLTTGVIGIDDALEINGGGKITISGNLSTRIFNTSPSPPGTSITLSGLTISNGSAPQGSVILGDNEIVTITDCTLLKNTATPSGLITPGIICFTQNAALTLIRTTVSNSKGAAISFNDGGSLLILDSTITDNHSFHDGSGVTFSGTVGPGGLIIQNSTIADNSSNGSGGGVAVASIIGQAVIQNSTIINNKANSGGGIAHVSGTGKVVIQNSTIIGNSAVTNGGGIAQISGTGTVSVESSIVSGNICTNSPDISSTSTVNVNYSAIKSNLGFVFIGGNNLPFDADLKLRPLANNGGPTLTIAFEFDSPLRGKGSNPAGLTTDQRGINRVNDGIDIGALELNTTVTNTNDSGNGSLRAAIAESNRVVGAEVITFDASFNTAKTIFMKSGEYVFNSGHSVTIDGPGANLLTISGNVIGRVFNFTNGDPLDVFTLQGMTLANGVAPVGGAILGNDEIININNCAFVNNTANSIPGGGAIHFNSGGTLSISNSTFSNNKAVSSTGRGGAIHMVSTSSKLNFINSTLSNNSAAFAAGAIFSLGIINICNSTITANTSIDGGAIVCGTTNGNLTIQSSVVSGNTAMGKAPDIFGNGTVNVSHSAIGSLNGWLFGSGSGNLPPGTNLKLGPLAKNGGPTLTHMPAIDSPLRGKGINPLGLATDQRGYPRSDGVGNFDIGAVQVKPTEVLSVTRVNPNPTALANVEWTVKLADSVTGITAANFTLSGDGSAGAGITSVTGSGATYTVMASTGSEGDLTLNFANSLGMDVLPSNLPFVGETYTVNKGTPVVISHIANDTILTDADVGPSRFHFSVTFSEAMNTSIAPTISFPADNPGGSLVFASGSWIANNKYQAFYNVNDLGVSLNNVLIQVTNAKDQAGSVQVPFMALPALIIDTANPVISKIERVNPLNNKLPTVSWNLTFSELVTGLSPGIFTLLNGGLTGSPTVTAVTGSGKDWTVEATTGGSGEGTLTLAAVSAGSTVDLNGNPLAALPTIGGSYNIDFISPAASKLTLNTLVVSDANVGTNGFAATLKYNELMDTSVAPAVTFPATSPGATLTANGGAWLDAQTYQAKFNVADLGVEINDISIRFTDAQDLAGNIQTPFDAANIFDIDTKNPIVASITSATPNGTYGVGQSIDVTLNFSEPVELTGTLNVTLDTGAVVSIAGPISSTSLSGTYVIGAGENSPDLNVTAIALTGGSTLRDAATNQAVLTLPTSNLANNAEIVISTGSTPAVTSLLINTGDAQRSRILTIDVSFAGPVNAAAFQSTGLVTLTRISATPTGGLAGFVVNTGNGLIVSQNGSITLRLTFENIVNNGVENTSLADGRWILGVNPAGFTSSDANPAQAIRRLYGDLDSNQTVDGTDFGFFGTAFGGANVPFDFDNNGTIDGSDFGQLGARVGVTI